MKLAGFLLLAMGWVLVMAAVILLSAPAARNAFVAAGIGVELLGFGIAARAHLAPGSGSAAGRD